MGNLMRNIHSMERFVSENNGGNVAYIVGTQEPDPFALFVTDDERRAKAFLNDEIRRRLAYRINNGELEPDWDDPASWEDVPDGQEEFDYTSTEEYADRVKELSASISDDLFLDDYDLSDPKQASRAFEAVLMALEYGGDWANSVDWMLTTLFGLGADPLHMLLVDGVAEGWPQERLEELAKGNDFLIDRLAKVFPGIARSRKSARLFGI